MRTNNVRTLRRKVGLPLAKVAESLGVHWRTLSRIEHGAQLCHLAWVRELAVILKCTVDDLYPGALAAIEKARASSGGLTETDADLERIGIDPDFRLWFFKYRLESGYEGYFPVSGPEKSRLFSGVQRMNLSDKSYVGFQSQNYRALLNVDALAYCHFLYDSPQIKEDMHDEEDPRDTVVVYLRGDPKPIEFEPELEGQEDPESDDMGDFGHIFVMAEELTPDEPYTFHFVDVDGEDVFIQAKQLALLIVPLSVFHPDLIEDEENIRQEGDAAL